MNDVPVKSDPIGRKIVRRANQELQDCWKLLKWRLYNVGRHPKPFATHLPILVGLPGLRPIRKVVEFGSGPFSTGAFLESNIYPELITLESYDDDPIWFDRVQSGHIGQQKLSLTLVEGPVSAAVEDASLDDADLIFVDDSKTRDARSATIEAACERLPDGAWLVIHDFEIGQYQTASRSAAYRYIFTTFKPHVGVLWNTPYDHAPPLKRLERMIRRKRRKIPIDDMHAWHEYFKAAKEMEAK